MGLDITWHSRLTKAEGNEAFDEHGEVRDSDGWFILYVNPDFPGRADEIESWCAYRCEAYGHFSCGPYSRYNRWRDELAKLAGWPLGKYEQYGRDFDSYAASAWDATDGPFWELITFSDCEGVIGASVSAKLAKDFDDHQAKADEHPDEYFRQQYAEWRNAFEKATDRGCVRFH